MHTFNKLLLTFTLLNSMSSLYGAHETEQFGTNVTSDQFLSKKSTFNVGEYVAVLRNDGSHTIGKIIYVDNLSKDKRNAYKKHPAYKPYLSKIEDATQEYGVHLATFSFGDRLEKKVLNTLIEGLKDQEKADKLWQPNDYLKRKEEEDNDSK